MTLTIEAIYENGVLKPAQPLPLKEHERVTLTVQPARRSLAEEIAFRGRGAARNPRSAPHRRCVAARPLHLRDAETAGLTGYACRILCRHLLVDRTGQSQRCLARPSSRVGPAHPDAKFVTTEEVLSEFLAWFARTGAGRPCSRQAQRFAAPRRSVHAGLAPDLRRLCHGPTPLRGAADKDYSLTDCRSMVAMRRLGVAEILTNDHHFTQEGFTDLVHRPVIESSSRRARARAPAGAQRKCPHSITACSGPAQPLAPTQHETVRITIEPQLGWAERTAGMLKWTGDPEVLRRITEDDEFSVLEST